MDISNIIALLSGVALFLFGMTLMGDGLKKVAGNKLELVLFQLSNTPLKGLLLGTGVTAIIQSSSATSVMVVGFVNSGMMKVRQAIGIVMGSIIGTSITGWIISLSYLDSASGWVNLISTATITGVIAVTGIILRMFCKKPILNHVGDILMGFAVLMFGMQAMSGAVSPLKDSPAFRDTLTNFSNPFLGILVGIVFTSVLQSASAAVGILQAMSATGAIDFSIALPILMGIAIGAALPVLLSALGASTAGKRTALVYLVVEVAGVIIWACLFYLANALLQFSFLKTVMNPFSIAFLNTLFRIVKVVFLLPFIRLIEKFVVLIVPEKENVPEVNDRFMLEERFLQHPTLAVEQSRITICDMAAEARENLFKAFGLLKSFNEAGFKEVQASEDLVDKYEDALGTYLIKLNTQELNPQQNEAISKYLHTLSDFERISDHSLNLAITAKEMQEKQIQFSDAAAAEMDILISAVREIVRITFEAFMLNDLSAAERVEPLEERIDELCDEIKLNHVERLQRGKCSLSFGFVLNDLLTNLERVADHCSNIAVAMIEVQVDAFDTHEYLKQARHLRTESYARYIDEYSSRFTL